MVFSSSLFLFIFLPITLLGYFVIRKELRNIFLLVMSLGFYAWGEPKFVFIMIGSILINYLSGLGIAFGRKYLGKILTNCILIISILLNLGLLFYYKYLDFVLSSINFCFKTNLPILGITLPIGISFFTFQGMSYVIDLYRDKVPVQKKLLNVALYIAMFPQLIAGPIVRYIDVNEQIDERTITMDQFAEGVRRFIIGLAKKAIIANQLALVADNIFDIPANNNSIATAWLGIICYSFQIFFDFSGYSDMAIGLGKMFGFEFLENFNYPYISTSITEFWRRWHISLSTWFRDYIYFPLGGSRRGNVYVNLFIVFLVTGIWHGAAFNFIVWGVWHGAFRLIEKYAENKNIKIKLPIFVKWIYTMIVVIIGWVFFKSVDFSYAIQYLGVMFGVVKSVDVGYSVSWYLTPKIIFILAMAVLASISYKECFSKTYESIKGTYLEMYAKNIFIVVLMFLSIMFVMTSTYNPFIYFRF